MAHALIVGGGLIGLLTARALRARGLDATVLERGRCGAEASWAGGGILSPLHPWRFPDAVNRLARDSRTRWPALAELLHERTGIDPEYRERGMLVVDPDDPAEVGAWGERFDELLVPLEREAVEERVPGLRPPPGYAWWLPDVASVRNPRLLSALRAVAVAEGVVLREGVEVDAVAVAGHRAIGVDTADGRVPGDAVVVCAGAWSARLLEGLGAEPPGIRPMRGQMLAFAGEPGRVGPVVLADGRYLIPREDGVVLAGSTVEEAGFEHATTDGARAELEAHATGLLPALADCPVIAHWCGLRPGSDDGVPTIAPHPALAGLWLNAGHFRNGIVTAPASAEIAAALVAGEPPPLDPLPHAWPG